MTITETLRRLVSDFAALVRKYKGRIPVLEQRSFQDQAVRAMHAASVDFVFGVPPKDRA